MSAVSILRELLAANSPLTGAVSASRIFAGAVPENSALPAISVMEVSAAEVPTIDATAPTTIVEGRAQVTVMAADYASMKNIHKLARKACNYQRGVINTYTVISVRRVANGPDFIDPDTKVAFQSVDFSVLYHEPN